jgi:dihydrofolate reductase
MRVILIVAQSLDGFIARHDEPGVNWTSPADKTWFRQCLSPFDAQVMARKTYETVRDHIQGNQGPGPLRIVMTRRPQDYPKDHQPGKLEFTSDAASAIVDRLRAGGCSACALLGGSSAHDAFLAAGEVDEIWVTLEPRLFGQGTPIVAARQDRTLTLLTSERLPDSDSLLLKYRVLT